MVLMLAFFAAFLASCEDKKTREKYPVRLTADGPIDATLVKKLYDVKCALCHGHDGAQQFAGAKNLTQSVLPKNEVYQRIAEGRGSMPPHKEVLTEEQMDALAEYVLTLR